MMYSWVGKKTKTKTKTKTKSELDLTTDFTTTLQKIGDGRAC